MQDKSKSRSGSEPKKEVVVTKEGNPTHIAAQTFTFRELAAVTQNFNSECLLGEGGFGRVYKGRLENGQVTNSFVLFSFVLPRNISMLLKIVTYPRSQILDKETLGRFATYLHIHSLIYLLNCGL